MEEDRIAFLRGRIQNLEQQALSSTLQNSTGEENQTLQLLGKWIIEAKDELRQEYEIKRSREEEECEIRRRREEELFQLELKQKKMKLEGI
jgi:hypothetical protein